MVQVMVMVIMRKMLGKSLVYEFATSAWRVDVGNGAMNEASKGSQSGVMFAWSIRNSFSVYGF